MATTATKERPILFRPELVRAILDGRIVFDDSALISAFNLGMTTKEIAHLAGCSTYPVKKALKRLGLRRPAKRRPGVGCGSGNSSWKGGRRIRPDGYVAVWTACGERLEHQLVMEKYLGRPLESSEIVHHKDRDRQNNAIDNLEVMSRSQHAREHRDEMRIGRYGR